MLPASESDWAPWAGRDGITARGLELAAGEPAFPPPLHAVASMSGTATTAAGSTRNLSATSRSLPVPGPPLNSGLSHSGLARRDRNLTVLGSPAGRLAALALDVLCASLCPFLPVLGIIVRWAAQCSDPIALAAGRKAPLCCGYGWGRHRETPAADGPPRHRLAGGSSQVRRGNPCIDSEGKYWRSLKPWSGD